MKINLDFNIKDDTIHEFKKVYPWGALMGVRPTKLVRRFLIMGYSCLLYTSDAADEL